MANGVTWFEVAGKDREALKGFYSQLFDWKLSDMEEHALHGRRGGGRRASRVGSAKPPTAIPATSSSTSRSRTSTRRWQRSNH